MGLRANIYKGEYDCSNGGISSEASRVTVVNVDGPFKSDGDAPAVLLMPGHLPGVAHLVPAVEIPGDGPEVWTPMQAGAGPMMGGCYVGTSDGRFSEAVEAITGSRFYGAVPLHDRFESAKLAREVTA